MRCSTLDCPLWSTLRKKSVDQSGSKRITTTNTIEYLDVLAHGSFVELAVNVTNSAPIVDRRGLRTAQRRRHDLEVWKLMHCPLDHPMKARDVEFGNVLVLSFDFEPERRSEILLVADHHIHKRRKLAIHGNSPRLTTN